MTRELVGRDEVGEVLAQLVMRIIVIALDGRLLDRPVHPFDLAVRPRMPWLGEVVFDVAVSAGQLERKASDWYFLSLHFPDILGRPAIAGRIGEVGTIVSEHRVDPVWHGCGEVTQKVTSDAPSGLLMQLDKGELGRPVDRHQQVELALLRSHLGKIDVEVADGIRFELLSDRLVVIDLGQSADIVTL